MNLPVWKTVLLATLLAMTGTCPAAEGMDLDCGNLSQQTVARLDEEKLLNGADAGRRKARAIIMELCSGREATAREQHEAGVQRALDNRFFENQPEKPGNRRLKNLKR